MMKSCKQVLCLIMIVVTWRAEGDTAASRNGERDDFYPYSTALSNSLRSNSGPLSPRGAESLASTPNSWPVPFSTTHLDKPGSREDFVDPNERVPQQETIENHWSPADPTLRLNFTTLKIFIVSILILLLRASASRPSAPPGMASSRQESQRSQLSYATRRSKFGPVLETALPQCRPQLESRGWFLKLS